MFSDHLLLFLKRYVPADERTVNRLFVSIFLETNRLKRPRASFLSQYSILSQEPDFSLLQRVSKYFVAEYGNEMSFERLVRMFEFVVSPADRIVTGAVYTPLKVRNTILHNCLKNKTTEELRHIRIADISCGCGGFLMDASIIIHQKTGKSYFDIFKDNIFGIDLQGYAIERTKILLSLLALSEGEEEDFVFHLLCRDTLDYATGCWDMTYDGFDVIVGNPPYVCSRNMSTEIRSKLEFYEVCDSGHPDLYIPFFQIAVTMLNDNGYLGYITMNTFLRSINGRALRNFFSRNRFAISIVDFRGFQIFESRNTYTCLFYLNKGESTDSINYAVDELGSLSGNVSYSTIMYEDMDDEKGWTINHYAATKALETIGMQIKDYCPSRHGIATLSNKTYIFKPTREDDNYYYLERNDKLFPIEKGICRDVINPNKLNTNNDLEILKEKLIFPYQIEGGRAIVISPEDMSKRYPFTLEYLISQKDTLLARDKGKTDTYPQWYAFGRTQSLIMPRYKLFFPKFANRPLRCVINDTPELMLYNGLAFVNSDERRLKILKVIIESELFWDYIKANGKPYASNYYSLSGVDIKHFGIPFFTYEEEEELLNLNNREEIECWLRMRYVY